MPALGSYSKEGIQAAWQQDFGFHSADASILGCSALAQQSVSQTASWSGLVICWICMSLVFTDCNIIATAIQWQWQFVMVTGVLLMWSTDWQYRHSSNAVLCCMWAFGLVRGRDATQPLMAFWFRNLGWLQLRCHLCTLCSQHHACSCCKELAISKIDWSSARKCSISSFWASEMPPAGNYLSFTMLNFWLNLQCQSSAGFWCGADWALPMATCVCNTCLHTRIITSLPLK